MDFEKTFDNNWRIYDRVRPEYPSQMFDDIFIYKNIDKFSRVFEIGIGTGKATQPFIDRKCQVASVEPGVKMAKYMRQKYVEYEDFSCYNFTFEKYMGINNTFDLIYSGTAFHWIDQETGYTKVFKLLKNGGAFARFNYHAGEDKTRPELALEIREIYNKYFNTSSEYKEYSVEEAAKLSIVAEKYGFTDIQYKIYNFTKDFTDKEYIDLLKTYPDHMKLDEEIRKEFFNEIKKTIKKYGGIITVHYILDLHLCRKP